MDKKEHINPHRLLYLRKCEKRLSPFGQKVLINLIKLKNDAQNKVSYSNLPINCRYQNKRLLTTPKTPLIINELSLQDNIISDIDNSPRISISIDLLKTIDSNNECDNISKTLKLSNPIEVEFPNPLALKENYENRTFNKKQNDGGKESEAITWNDIFDDEIFSGIIDFGHKIHDNESNEQNLRSINRQFYKDTNNLKPTVENELKHNLENNENIQSRRQNNEIILNKVKTNILNKSNTIKRNSLRKEKYTKSIKNWLNDVDRNNTAEKEPKTNGIDKDGTHTKASYTKHANDAVSKQKKIKKTVQAQLANKDGIMKFRKPKKLDDESINIWTTDKLDISSSATTDKTAKITKKAVARFVAPIKSQIPVIDVNYAITIGNNENFNCSRQRLEILGASEIVLIIIYGNGFNQLNCQHTDASCVPEGILFHFNDVFYYLQGKINGCADVLRNVLKTNTFICYDAKDLIIYLKCQFELPSLYNLNIMDVKIGSSLMNPDKPPENFSDVQKLLEYTPAFTIATECALQKAAWYSTVLKEISIKLRSSLVGNGLWKVFVDTEMKILPIVSEMQHRGVSVDIDELKSMENILMNRMNETEIECHKAAGKAFQINSTVQVRTILYDELKLDTKSNVKIRETICKGAKSTSETMLRSLTSVHPLPKLILEYRHLHKARATFLSGIAQHVKNGIVKPVWDQTAAATGRIASNNPNLQAIPKTPFNLVLFPKEDDGEGLSNALNFRSVYIARAGYSLLAADFKHVECRVFAQSAADSGLQLALARPDLFRVLAAQWLNKPEDEVSSEDRERTKRIVYASLYGAGTRTLMEILNLGYDQVLSIMTSLNRTFPSLKSFGRSVVSECEKRKGRLTIASGRARTFNNICSSNFTEKSHAERQAVNFVIQGTAADLCKSAMILTTERLMQTDPPVEGYLLLQIHDELVWEVANQDVDRASIIIKETMENCGFECGMGMKLPVAMYRGPNWGEMEEFTPNDLI